MVKPRIFLWACSILLPTLFPSSCATDKTQLTFHNTMDSKVHLFWEKPGPKHWPPAPPANAKDQVRVKCRIGRRSGDETGTSLAELKQDLKIRGEFVITVRKDWAPKGASHFLQLVKEGFFDGCVLFRAVKNFLVQFGISSNSDLQQKYRGATFPDDPPRPDLLPLPHGTLSYAGNGKDSRSSQLWLSFKDGVAGSMPWETPVGFVTKVDGLAVVDAINTKYGDMKPFGGNAPENHLIDSDNGLNYLLTEYPDIDYLESCKILAHDPHMTRHVSEKVKPSLVEVGVIQPGEKQTQVTLAGHTFVAKLGGADGKQLGQFTAEVGSKTVDLVQSPEL